ncbi:MAG: hypothetical protein KF704_12195 [Crocinitomicaceae bacterium]|nr:hypothetical protein [Crocinitomicaceae bacterium]NGF74950.1 hypothetical protein [Fluviicola sp. SGL-29]
MNRMVFAVVALILLSLHGCNTPVVESKKPKRLYIASDFLTPADSILFKDFKKRERIKIVILPMSVDSIVAHYNEKKYNSTFDLVLMKSTYALDFLAKNNVLHTIEETHTWENKGFVAPQSDWMILGLDPYVITGAEKNRGFQYNELTYGKKWKNELNQKEMAAFQASVLFQFGRKNMNKSLTWLEKIEGQTATPGDTVQTAPYVLSRLSHVQKDGKLFVYPNQSIKFGVFYDGVGVGIIRQASKYTAALSFISYYSNLVYNQKLCNRLHLLPVQNPNGMSSFSYQNDYPILFRCTPRDMVMQFRDLKRIRKRI